MFSVGTPEGTRDLSFEMSFVLIGMYAMNVLVTMLGGGGGTSLPEGNDLMDDNPASPAWRSLLVLGVAAAALGAVTEVVSHLLEPTARQLGLSNTFSGLVLLGGVGSLGEVLRGTTSPAATSRCS